MTLIVDDLGLEAIWWRLVVEPGSDVRVDLTVPAGEETGTWTADVWSNERRTTHLQSFACVPSGLTITATLTAAQLDAICPTGDIRVRAHWDWFRHALDGTHRRWVKGDFIVNAGLEPS